MTELEIQSRVEALREDALTIARELSHRAARPGMGYRETLAAEQMQNAANVLGHVQRSVSTLRPGGASRAA
jgi:hypothetical protein